MENVIPLKSEIEINELASAVALTSIEVVKLS
jgi:hypothetical protein